MEEKERYLLFIGQCCVDKEDKNKLINGLDRLNQQDKRIKELVEENQQLKQAQNDRDAIFFREIISLCRIGISDFDQSKKLGGENQQLKYSRKQLAIMKLKLIIYFMENTKNNHYLLPYEINNFIDSQIKELKEGK